jgi:hypothetical protein
LWSIALYYSSVQNPRRQEFFGPAGTLVLVKLFRIGIHVRGRGVGEEEEE